MGVRYWDQLREVMADHRAHTFREIHQRVGRSIPVGLALRKIEVDKRPDMGDANALFDAVEKGRKIHLRGMLHEIGCIKLDGSKRGMDAQWYLPEAMEPVVGHGTYLIRLK